MHNDCTTNDAVANESCSTAYEQYEIYYNHHRNPTDPKTFSDAMLNVYILSNTLTRIDCLTMY